MTTWRKLIEIGFYKTGDHWNDIIKCTLTEEEKDVEFDDGYGCTEGKPFTAWSKKWVYFPACYDGAEWVAYVSRVIDGKPTEHVGGG